MEQSNNTNKYILFLLAGIIIGVLGYGLLDKLFTKAPAPSSQVIIESREETDSLKKVIDSLEDSVRTRNNNTVLINNKYHYEKESIKFITDPDSMYSLQYELAKKLLSGPGQP